jgi:hypothetical protein
VQLQQVFLNLSPNASDAGEGDRPGVGALTISTMPDEGGAAQTRRVGIAVGVMGVWRPVTRAHSGRLSAIDNASGSARGGAGFRITLPEASEANG